MIPLRLSEIARVVDGEVTGDDVEVTGEAYVDSRSPAPGGLFVAVVGERVDGHDFADGAHAVLGSRPTPAPTVVTADPVAAVGRLARHVVQRVRPTVLAMTGSQGKTGTKDYLAQVLATSGPTVATRGNHNNEIGVPLTVLQATTDTRHLVVEMGARGEGHIGYLCEIAPPDVAAVLNVGTAHLSEFGSREGIARAKGEIVEALGPGGTAVLNHDDDLVMAMADRTQGRVLTFGGPGADVALTDLEPDDLGRCSFRLSHEGEVAPVRLRQLGAHQALNAAAAAAMALAAGVDLGSVAEALSSARTLSRWRMELHERADGVAVVNDAYNANPESTVAALDTLTAIGRRSGRRTIAVLGEMLELADPAGDHRRVGRHAADAGVDVLVTVGDTATAYADGAADVTGWPGRSVRTAGRDDALEWVRHNVAPGDVVLVKASRGAALELVAEGLLDDEGGAAT